MNKALLVFIIIIFIGSAALFIVFNRLSSSTSSISPTPSRGIPPTSPSRINLEAGGSSYLDGKGVYSILYPNDYVLDTQDPIHIRIYKRGETQRPQSEMSDGALMVFESIELQGKSLETWVDASRKQPRMEHLKL